MMSGIKRVGPRGGEAGGLAEDGEVEALHVAEVVRQTCAGRGISGSRANGYENSSRKIASSPAWSHPLSCRAPLRWSKSLKCRYSRSSRDGRVWHVEQAAKPAAGRREGEVVAGVRPRAVLDGLAQDGGHQVHVAAVPRSRDRRAHRRGKTSRGGQDPAPHQLAPETGNASWWCVTSRPGTGRSCRSPHRCSRNARTASASQGVYSSPSRSPPGAAVVRHTVEEEIQVEVEDAYDALRSWLFGTLLPSYCRRAGSMLSGAGDRKHCGSCGKGDDDERVQDPPPPQVGGRLHRLTGRTRHVVGGPSGLTSGRAPDRAVCG